MSAAAHLARLLHGRLFRRLFSVRLASQLTDGVFQVALASYALFSADQPSPGAIAAALAVVLLPFSLLGPFAGVFLDRWSRRDVLVWSNLGRVAGAVALAAVVAAGLPDVVFYGLVLACLSVNRFLLAGLSAALPHTVVEEDLVEANSLTPTAGTLAFVVGLALGGGLREVTRHAGWDGNVSVLLGAALGYAAAGALAARIGRSALGPDHDPDRPAVAEAVRHVLVGLWAGLGHLRSRRPPAAALATIASQRYWIGIFSVSLVLLYRNTFHPGDADAAFAGIAAATVAAGAGFLAAAVVTPLATDRFAPRTWIVVLLVAGAVVQLVPVGLYTQTAVVVGSLALGLVSQGIKICVDTIVQAGIDDAFRGRVFSIYDVLFNVAFVAAAATAAVVLPEDGRSHLVLGVVAAGYLVTAAAYWAATRPEQQPRYSSSADGSRSARPG
jgi:MFS family permease